MVKDLTRSVTKCHIPDAQLFSIYRWNPYNFTLKNFLVFSSVLVLLKIKGAKLK